MVIGSVLIYASMNVLNNAKLIKSLECDVVMISENNCSCGLRKQCLFVWGFMSHSRIFHSYRDVTITGEGLQMLTYDTGHPFIMVISEDP